MEFRTGNRRAEVRDRKVAALNNLRERLGREIHPIIVGNIEAASLVGQYFLFYTAVDSTPVIKTIKRQRMVSRAGHIPVWRTQPVASNTCMASAFEENYRNHSAGVEHRLAGGVIRRNIPESTSAAPPAAKISADASPSSENEMPLFHS
jgi:hypothetical protein